MVYKNTRKRGTQTQKKKERQSFAIRLCQLLWSHNNLKPNMK